MNYKEIKEYATKIDSTLRADDKTKFNKIVHVVHEDGSTFILMYSHVEEHDNWYIVFSEHNGWHVFHKDETVSIKQYNF